MVQFHRFTWINTIIFLVTIVIIWAFAIQSVAVNNQDVGFFIARQFIYRTMELTAGIRDGVLDNDV